MKTSQEIVQEINRLYDKYEEDVLSAKKNGLLKDNTVRTYLLNSGNFVKWCSGAFVPGDKNARR